MKFIHPDLPDYELTIRQPCRSKMVLAISSASGVPAAMPLDSSSFAISKTDDSKIDWTSDGNTPSVENGRG